MRDLEAVSLTVVLLLDSRRLVDKAIVLVQAVRPPGTLFGYTALRPFVVCNFLDFSFFRELYVKFPEIEQNKRAKPSTDLACLAFLRGHGWKFSCAIGRPIFRGNLKLEIPQSSGS